MRPNKDGLCSSEGQMGVLFMLLPDTPREAPSGHFKAEEVCMCSLPVPKYVHSLARRDNTLRAGTVLRVERQALTTYELIGTHVCVCVCRPLACFRFSLVCRRGRVRHKLRSKQERRNSAATGSASRADVQAYLRYDDCHFPRRPATYFPV